MHFGLSTDTFAVSQYMQARTMAASLNRRISMLSMRNTQQNTVVSTLFSQRFQAIVCYEGRCIINSLWDSILRKDASNVRRYTADMLEYIFPTSVQDMAAVVETQL